METVPIRVDANTAFSVAIQPCLNVIALSYLVNRMANVRGKLGEGYMLQRTMFSRSIVLLAFALILTVVAACSSGDGDDASSSAGSSSALQATVAVPTAAAPAAS